MPSSRPIGFRPTNQATPEVTARLLKDLGCADEDALWRRLGGDKRKMVEPRWTRAHHPDDPQADMWGIRYRKADYGTGTYDEPSYQPLAQAQTVDDVHAHRWPSPDDFDYSVVTRAVEESDGCWPKNRSAA